MKDAESADGTLVPMSFVERSFVDFDVSHRGRHGVLFYDGRGVHIGAPVVCAVPTDRRCALSALRSTLSRSRILASSL